ncbi:Fic family protein [Mollicutes bacterium LVI A0039]|nr:Fic family protein [Mollicutes bacterium LVI A0039]
MKKYKTNNAVKLFGSKVVDTVYDQSRLDGLRTSYISTEKLVIYNVASEGMKLDEIQVLKNLKSVHSFIVLNYNDVAINVQTLSAVHKIISHDIIEEQNSGHFRRSDVFMRNLSKPLKINPVSSELFQGKLDEIMGSSFDTIKKAKLVGALIIKEQPFADCNKRTAFSIMNLILIKENIGFVNMSEEIILSDFQDALEDLFINNNRTLFESTIDKSLLYTEDYLELSGIECETTYKESIDFEL